MGYEKKDESRSQNFLRILDVNSGPYEMYDFKSDSWKVLAIETPLDGDICLFQDALSVKGDACWVATEKLGTMKKKFVICFDFTKERLGEGLQSLPFDSCESVIVIL